MYRLYCLLFFFLANDSMVRGVSAVSSSFTGAVRRVMKRTPQEAQPSFNIVKLNWLQHMPKLALNQDANLAENPIGKNVVLYYGAYSPGSLVGFNNIFSGLTPIQAYGIFEILDTLPEDFYPSPDKNEYQTMGQICFYSKAAKPTAEPTAEPTLSKIQNTIGDCITQLLGDNQRFVHVTVVEQNSAAAEESTEKSDSTISESSKTVVFADQDDTITAGGGGPTNIKGLIPPTEEVERTQEFKKMPSVLDSFTQISSDVLKSVMFGDCGQGDVEMMRMVVDFLHLHDPGNVGKFLGFARDTIHYALPYTWLGSKCPFQPLKGYEKSIFRSTGSQAYLDLFGDTIDTTCAVPLTPLKKVKDQQDRKLFILTARPPVPGIRKSPGKAKSALVATEKAAKGAENNDADNEDGFTPIGLEGVSGLSGVSVEVLHGDIKTSSTWASVAGTRSLSRFGLSDNLKNAANGLAVKKFVSWRQVMYPTFDARAEQLFLGHQVAHKLRESSGVTPRMDQDVKINLDGTSV